MYRQLKNDKRSFIYEVDPTKIRVKAKSSSAEWLAIDKVATRVWVCTQEGVRCKSSKDLDTTSKKLREAFIHYSLVSSVHI